MRFKDWKTRKEWDEVLPESHLTGDPLKHAEEGCREHRDRLMHTLKDLLLADHFMVLCGSGTSLDLNTAEGKEVDPKVAPTMADLWKSIKRRIEAKEIGLFQKILNYVNYTPEKGSENVESLLSACLISERFKSTVLVNEFLDEAEREIASKCRFPKGHEDLSVHENFLRRVARRPPHLPRTKLFTTNYDLCFEKAAANARFLAMDGFSHSLPQEFDVSFYTYDWVRRDDRTEKSGFIPNLFHLYKLHGSVDWQRTENSVIKNPHAERPLLLYPNRDRFEFALEPPFLEIMSRFQFALRQPNTSLLIIGFGFNDMHLSKPILQAIQYNVSLRVTVASQMFDFEMNDHQKSIRRLVETGDPRLSLIWGEFEDLVRVLPNLAERTLEEEHNDRVRKLMPRAA